jgi:hypothetical protein
MQKTKAQSQSHNERPTAAPHLRAGRRSTATTTQARASRAVPSAAPAKQARSAKPKGPDVPAVAAVVAATPTPPRQPRASSKQAAVVALLRRSEGADLAILMATTGWQSHSVRAVLSGLRKQGHHLHRDAGPHGSVYRLMAQAGDTEG